MLTTTLNNLRYILNFFLLFLLVISDDFYAQSAFDCHQSDPKAEYRDHPIDITRMKLELNFEPIIGKVKGKVTHYFTPLRKVIDSLYFNAPNITILSCLINGEDMKWKTSSKGVTVFCTPVLHWEKNDSLTINYEVTPQKGIYFIGWNDSNNRSRKQIWTQGEEKDNRNWIPMYDATNDKYITETIITFDKDYNVLSNGTLLNGEKNYVANQPLYKPEVNKDKITRTWHYRMQHPHVGYLLMLAIGKYAVKTSYSKSGVRICNWYYPEWENRYNSTFSQTNLMMDFLEEEIGVKFPWESYGNVMVQDFLYGAMENTTATIFGDFFCVDPRGYIDNNYNRVNCHEMTHQWFGDLVTCEDWNDKWLQESFATFYPKLYAQKYVGEDSYEWQRRIEQNATLESTKTNQTPIRNVDAGRAFIYQKGSTVLDMLRHYIGKEEFHKVIQHYLQKNSYQNVTTYHFEQAFKDVLGVNLKWFFDEWIYRGGIPEYTISYQQVTSNNQPLLLFTVQQTQQINELKGLFKMPVAIEAFYTDGTKDSSTIWVEKQTETFQIPLQLEKKLSFVLFDPGSWITKNVIFKKSLIELKNQLAHAPLMIDRFDALVALRNANIDSIRNNLIDAYNNNSFQAIRAEVVLQLAQDTNKESIAILLDAFNDKDVNVRMAAIKNCTLENSSFQPYFEKALNDSSYNVVQLSLQQLVTFSPTNASVYLNKTKDVYGMNNSVRIKWLELSVLNTKGNEQLPFLNELVAYTSNSYEFRTRINAINSLKLLNYCDDVVVDNLFNAAFSNNSRLSESGITILDNFFTQTKFKLIIHTKYMDGKWNERENNLLKEYK